MGLYSSSLFLFGRCINELRMAKYTVINGSKLHPPSLSLTHTHRRRERERFRLYASFTYSCVCVCLVRIYKQASQTHPFGPAAPENLRVCVSGRLGGVASREPPAELTSDLICFLYHAERQIIIKRKPKKIKKSSACRRYILPLFPPP